MRLEEEEFARKSHAEALEARMQREGAGGDMKAVEKREGEAEAAAAKELEESRMKGEELQVCSRVKSG